MAAFFTFHRSFLPRCVIFTFAIMVSMPLTAVAALNCTVQPSCSELGYSKTITASCPADKIILCPFDLSYKLCVASSCPALSCPDGWIKDLTSTAQCGAKGTSGWIIESFSFSESLNCGKCQCQAENSCIWNTSNAGKGTLSNECCNGNFKTCTNKCVNTFSGTIPANASGKYENCAACGTSKTILTGFACNTNYKYIDDKCWKCGAFYGYSDSDAYFRCRDNCDRGDGTECGMTGDDYACDRYRQCSDDCEERYSEYVTCP